jgi:hypothetical protein
MQGEVARVALIEGSTQEVPTWVMMTKRPTQQVLTQVESGTILIRDVLTYVEMVAADASPGVDGIHADEVKPRSCDVIGGDASGPMSLGGRAQTWWCIALVQACPGHCPGRHGISPRVLGC